MQAIIFALLSYIGWGTGDVFATQAARKIGPYSATFWYLFLSFIIFLPLGVFFISDISKISLELILFTLGIAVIGNIGLATFYEGIRIGNAAVVGTISSSFVAITVLLSIVFLKETITIQQALAILIILIGIVLSGLNLKGIRIGNILSDKGLIYGLISMLTWGIYWAFIKIPIEKINWYWPAVIAFGSFPIIYIYILLRKIRLNMVDSKNSFSPIFLNALITGIGSLTFNFAISKGLTSIVIPIAGSYPTLFAVLAYFIFKDPITKQQILGIATTLLGIVLLSIFSV